MSNDLHCVIGSSKKKKKTCVILTFENCYRNSKNVSFKFDMLVEAINSLQALDSHVFRWNYIPVSLFLTWKAW